MTQFADPHSQSQSPRTTGMKHFVRLTHIALLPVWCLHAAWIVPSPSPCPRGPESSTAQARDTCLLFPTLVKSPFTECRLCQVSEKRWLPANIDCQFCLTLASRVWGVLWTSWTIQPPFVNEMGLLMYSKSHNKKSQRELGKNSMPHSYHASLGLVLSGSSTFLSVNEMLLRLEWCGQAGGGAWWLFGVTIDLDLLFGCL